MPNSCLSSWERHSPGRWSDLQESHQAGPNFTLETEAQRGGKTFRHHTARKRPRWARTWPKAGRDVPSFWSQVLSLLPGHWGRHNCGRERHAASPQSPCEGKQVLWSPERLQRPSSAPGAPAEMHKLVPVEDPVLCFRSPARPVETPSRLPGLCRIYLFMWELSSEHGAEGCLVGGLLTAASRGSCGTETQQESGPGRQTSDQPRLVRTPALESWLELSGREAPASWGSRAADCLATGLWVHPSPRTCLGDSG